jgi:hypothetical protein
MCNHFCSINNFYEKRWHKKKTNKAPNKNEEHPTHLHFFINKMMSVLV